MNSPVISLVLISTLYTLCQGVAVTWTKEEEDKICALGDKKELVCPNDKGPADEVCKKAAAAVGGTNPTCSDAAVCSFTKGSGTAYVLSDSEKKGYEISRNCVNSVGIGQPNKDSDLEDLNPLTEYFGISGKGKYEKTSLPKMKLCGETPDTQGMLNCQGDTLRNGLIKTFHPELRLGNLRGGTCALMVELNGEKDTQVTRCVVMGTYLNATSGKVEKFRLHLFNHGTDTAVVLMAYWGDATLAKISK